MKECKSNKESIIYMAIILMIIVCNIVYFTVNYNNIQYDIDSYSNISKHKLTNMPYIEGYNEFIGTKMMELYSGYRIDLYNIDLKEYAKSQGYRITNMEDLSYSEQIMLNIYSNIK